MPSFFGFNLGVLNIIFIFFILMDTVTVKLIDIFGLTVPSIIFILLISLTRENVLKKAYRYAAPRHLKRQKLQPYVNGSAN